MKLLEGVLSKRKVLWWVLFVTCCGFVVWMTLLRRITTERKYEFELFWVFRLWIENDPFGRDVLIQYVNNILFFIPLGVFLSEIVTSWKRVILLGFGISVVIEFTQFLTVRGLAAIDDVISNTVGTLIGALIWIVEKKLVERYINVR